MNALGERETRLLRRAGMAAAAALREMCQQSGARACVRAADL